MPNDTPQPPPPPDREKPSSQPDRKQPAAKPSREKSQAKAGQKQPASKAGGDERKSKSARKKSASQTGSVKAAQAKRKEQPATAPVPPPPPPHAADKTAKADKPQAGPPPAPPVPPAQQAAHQTAAGPRKASKAASPSKPARQAPPVSAPPPPPVEETDPRLETFLQKAAPILAVERGITAKSRVLLGAIAKDVGLSDDEFDDAVKALQQGRTEPSQAASPAVDGFHRYLHAKLHSFKGILTLELQRKAVEVAQEKFQLAAEPAQDVVNDVTKELSIRRISLADAERHVAKIISEKVGEAAWIDDGTQERLRAAGREWGLNVLEVDAVIRKHMAHNRRSQEADTRWLKVAVGVAGIAAIVLISLLAWNLVLKPDDIDDKPSDDAVASTDDALPPEPPPKAPTKPVEPPKWWDIDLLKAQVNARRKFPDYAPIYAEIASDDPAQRGGGYQKLVDVGREIWNDKSQLSLLQEIIVATHELEPDEDAAQALRDALLSWTAFAGQPLPDSPQAYDQAMWSVRTAVTAMLRAGVADDRADTMAEDLTRYLGRPVDRAAARAEITQQCMAALAPAMFSHLTLGASGQPHLAHRLQEWLSEEMFRHKYLDVAALQRLETEFLVAALPAAGMRWREFEGLIQICIASSDTLNGLKILEVYENSKVDELQEYLRRQLVAQFGVNPKSTERADVAFAIREKLGASIPTTPLTAPGPLG